MMEEMSGTQIEKATKSVNRKRLFPFFRWVFIIFITLYFFAAYDGDNKDKGFFWLLTLIVVYNVLVTFFFSGNKNRRHSKLIMFFDLALVALLCYHLGGIQSDMFILMFFIIGYGGVSNNLLLTMCAGIFAIVLYSMACIYASHSNVEELNFWRLIAKDLFILMASYGITIIHNEMKKYGELHKKEFKLARTDKLTGLANRHYFDQKLVEEVTYVHESGNPLNILIFDLDNFKKFNDSYGHLWGDKLLTLFSDIVMQNIRKSDTPVRYGGEEFLILIRDLDAHTAKGVGERIRRQLEKQRIYVGDEKNRKRVTVSCGVSQYPRDSKVIKEAIENADKALYHAKEIGKNIVVAYNEIGLIQRPELLEQEMGNER